MYVINFCFTRAFLWCLTEINGWMDGWSISANYLYNLMTLKRANCLKSKS